VKTFSTSFIALKNSLEGQVWTHLIDLQVNANSTAYFTSHPETLTYNSRVYVPVPFIVGAEEQRTGGELPQLTIDVSNYTGAALRFAKDNDLSMNDVTIRLINTTLTSSGQEDSTKLQILATVFTNEVARFVLGYNFNYDAEGPRRIYNRQDFPSIPLNQRQFAIF